MTPFESEVTRGEDERGVHAERPWHEPSGAWLLGQGLGARGSCESPRSSDWPPVRHVTGNSPVAHLQAGLILIFPDGRTGVEVFFTNRGPVRCQR
jgi:hypothetical protein